MSLGWLVGSVALASWLASWVCCGGWLVINGKVINGPWCLKMAFGLILLSFLLSFCYRFVIVLCHVNSPHLWDTHACIYIYVCMYIYIILSVIVFFFLIVLRWMDYTRYKKATCNTKSNWRGFFNFLIWHIFWHSIWHIFWHSFWHIFWHSVWHIFWHSFWHSFWHIFWHSIWHLFWHSSRWGPAVPTAIWKSRLRSGSAHWDLELAVEVRQCPLGARGWGPAVPTATWKPRLRPGSAHCDLQLAVEVRQCPLGSGARGGGPAVRTGIWTARRRRRVRSRRRRRWRRRRRRRTALIKSNNPHLAGGEKKTRCTPQTRMQSQRTLLWNKLFQQSTFFPCYRTIAL